MAKYYIGYSMVKQEEGNLFISCRFPRISIGFTLAIALFFLVYIPTVQTVDNVDYYILDDEASRYYKNFKQVFGNDEFFVIAYEDPDLFTEKSLTLLQNLTRELEDIGGLENITSLGNVDDIEGTEDFFEVAPFLEEFPQGKKELLALKMRALQNQLYIDNLISPDGRVSAIIVEMHERPEHQGYRKEVVTTVEEILAKYRDRVDQFYLAGGTITDLRLSQYLKRDLAIFIPLIFLLVVSSVWFFFRNALFVVLASVNVGVSVGVTLGLMGMTGIAINNVNCIVVPLVMSLALCDTVHIFSHLNYTIYHQSQDRFKGLSRVLRGVYLPCLLTSITTGIGFLSLSVSELGSIREFAYIASAAMVFEFLFSFFLLAPLLLFFSPDKVFQESRHTIKLSGFLMSRFIWIKNNRHTVVLAGCVVVLFAAWAATGIKVETNLIKFFKQSSQVRGDLDFVDQRLAGVMTLDVALKTEQEDGFKHPENLHLIETLQNQINSIDGVDKTISFVDFIKDMNESFHAEDSAYYKIPGTREAVAQYLLLYDSDDIEDFIASSYSYARISVRLTEHGSSRNKIVADNIMRIIEGLPEHGLEIRITGEAVDIHNVSTALVQGQIYSLALAIMVIAVLMGCVFKSIKLGCISLVPNLFPIVLNFGVMGISGIPLDTGTALIAVIAMGIAVDDTIHFLSEYQANRKMGKSLSDSVEQAILSKGKAVIASTVILCIGFGVLLFSSFVPIIHFGLLSVMTMIAAIVGDFVFLPAILLLKEKKPALTVTESCEEVSV